MIRLNFDYFKAFFKIVTLLLKRRDDNKELLIVRFIILFGGTYFPGLIRYWPLVFILELLINNIF